MMKLWIDPVTEARTYYLDGAIAPKDSIDLNLDPPFEPVSSDGEGLTSTSQTSIPPRLQKRKVPLPSGLDPES